MKLNYKKCELIKFGNIGVVRMRDGTIIKPMDEVNYLGCQLNNKADGIKEVKRIADCLVVLKKLDIFWRHGNASLKRKIQVQEAVINTKLMYGLESLQLPHDCIQEDGCLPTEGTETVIENGDHLCE